MTIQAQPPRFGGIARVMRERLPGFATALTIAAAANFVAMAYGGPVILLALLIGVALNFLSANPAVRPGLRFAAKPVLQVGVALLGVRISVEHVAALGVEALVLVITGVATTIFAGVAIAQLAKQDRTFGVLAGGATGICGASAALAISAVLPPTAERERETAFVIMTVTTLSTIAMVAYPVLAHALGFDDRTTGILLGATIHDVAQVVGAGYAVSVESGDTATVVKLFRVALLLPSVFFISVAYSRPRTGIASAAPPLPAFAIAFAVFVAVNSLGLVPAIVATPLVEFSRWCLVTAVASIGVRTSIADMVKMGRASLSVPVGATLILLLLVTTALLVEGKILPPVWRPG